MKEFAELYCNNCMCVNLECDLIDQATVWIKAHMKQIEHRFFEEVAQEYPGPFRAFMLAWVDEFGGI